jgi:kanamycin nucleotidyltransferase
MEPGPQAHSRTQRLDIAEQIYAQLREHYGADLLGLAFYGSLARGTDGPYSDIEMFCILEGEGIDTAFEWTTGPWKAEIDVLSQETVFEWANTVEWDWPLTHSAFLDVLPLYDPRGIFSRLKQTVVDTADDRIEAALRELVVGEIYELVGKLRNNRARGNHTSTALFIVELGQKAACLAGFANRFFYRSSATMLDDSLALPNTPDGHQELCQLVISGDLSNPDRCYATGEGYWNGMQTWMAAHGISLAQQLGELLTA